LIFQNFQLEDFEAANDAGNKPPMLPTRSIAEIVIDLRWRDVHEAVDEASLGSIYSFN
jgi:hypothetical protein